MPKKPVPEEKIPVPEEKIPVPVAKKKEVPPAKGIVPCLVKEPYFYVLSTKHFCV